MVDTPVIPVSGRWRQERQDASLVYKQLRVLLFFKKKIKRKKRKKEKQGAEEMTQQLSAAAFLAEDLESIPITNMTANSCV